MDKAAQNRAKQDAAIQALDFIQSDCILGVGTGSTVNYFIDELPKMRGKIEACVSSSAQTTERLKALKLPVVDLNSVPHVDIYVDGADEVDPHKNLIKGGGAALTLEKLVAVAAKNFVCIIDELKCVERLGRFPLPVEVLPMARSLVARQLVKLYSGMMPVWREGVVTDSGNVILDLQQHFWDEPLKQEETIKALTGVVEVGLFAKRQPDHLLIGQA